MSKNATSTITQLLHLKTEIGDVCPSVTPIFQNSAFDAGSEYFYTRKNNPNSEELERAVALLENANHAIAVTTGMTALSVCLNLLTYGQHLLINQDVYGCSYKLFQRLAKKMNLRLTKLDLSTQDGIDKIPSDIDMVVFETPTNPFLKTIDIRKVSDKIKSTRPKALVVVDNTWATPLFQKPLEHGADISLHSGTKYFGGHSDVMGGVILCNDPNLNEELKAERFYCGNILPPYSAWLMRRSLQTLPLRIKHQAKVTREIFDWLSKREEIEKVYYPEIDGKQLVDYGGIVFFKFSKKHQNDYQKFRDKLEFFGTGTGMACVTSMVAQPYSGSHASMNDEEKKEMSLGPDLVRLCFGLEEVNDIIQDLKSAFNSLS